MRLSQNVIYDEDQETGKKYLMDIETGTLFELNETAAILIKHVLEGKGLEEYITFVQNQYQDTTPVEQETIRNDMCSYVEALVEYGYLLKEA